MQVGLYSKLARQNVVAARALIAERATGRSQRISAAVARRFLAAEDGSLLKSASAFSDFFTSQRMSRPDVPRPGTPDDVADIQSVLG